MIVFSIIICTYNPNPEIFQRLLDAVLQLDNIQVEHEVILVDNNSSPAIALDNGVQSFLLSKKNAVVIKEAQPGLTNARIAGIKASKADWIIFFDDDNEPTADYLVEAQKIIQQFPQVGVWGPGNISVQFLRQPVNKWYQNHLSVFQERNFTNTVFDNRIDWLECYPYGTGMVVKKNIAMAYMLEVINGKYSLSDRIGKKLVSGGDTQMVLLGIKMGYYAGVSDQLNLNHLIAGKKINMTYILSQVYMTASCYIRAFNEINFDDKRIPLKYKGNRAIIKRIYTICRIYLFKNPFKTFLLILYGNLGEINARYFAAHVKSKPVVLKIAEKFIDV